MNKTGLIINAILFVLVAILFYLYFSGKDSTPKPKVNSLSSEPASSTEGFRIAYFEWDSITNKFELFGQMKNELNQKDEANAREKMKLRQQYQNKVNSYNRELSQTESEQAAQDLRALEAEITNKMQKLDQQLQQLQMTKENEVKTKIEEFLSQYSKDRGYSYVFAYEPGLIFYRDTIYNITADLVNGLNTRYPKAKKK